MSSRPGGKAPTGGGDAASTSYSNQGEFFLSNYRLGKTLGIGSFGKVCLSELGLASISGRLLAE